MSEFYPTTTVTFYTTYTPFDDYDEGYEDFDEEVVMSGIPMQILTATKSQYQPVDNRGTTVKTYAARLRGHHPVKLNYLIEDERTGIRYSIDDIDLKHNPIGDPSWVLTIRKVPTEAGE